MLGPKTSSTLEVPKTNISTPQIIDIEEDDVTSKDIGVTEVIGTIIKDATRDDFLPPSR